jgi:hypothetical protein
MAIILTPESDWEVTSLKAIAKEGASVEIKEGNFNWTRGGYVRWFPDEYGGPYHTKEKPEDHCIFLVLGGEEDAKQEGSEE